MTFSHDDIRERLVDYLYGELDGATRAAFQAHLTGCAACREEVTGAERARLVAREVVRRPLGDAVPERVRTRAFEAARAALAARAVAPGQAKAAIASPAPAAGIAAGWFARLRRRWTWTFPTFATVAAMAVFLLVRATIFREAKQPVSEERARELAKPAAAPAPAAPPEPSQEKSEAIRDVEREPEAAPADLRAAKGGGAASPAAGVKDGAARPRPAAASSGGHLHRKPAVGGLSSAGAPQAAGGAVLAQPASRAAPVRKAKERALPEGDALDDLDRASENEQGRLRARGQDAVRDEGIGEERNSATAPGTSAGAGLEASKASKKVAAEAAAKPAAQPAPRAAQKTGKRDFAPPPPPAAPAPAAAAPGKSGAIPHRESDRVENFGAVSSAAPAAETEPSNRAASEDKAPRAPATAPARADRSAMPAPDPVVVQVSRADGLMHARRWADAVAAYRELLRRYPSHPSAPLWRQRLAAAQAALAADTGQFATPPPQR